MACGPASGPPSDRPGAPQPLPLQCFLDQIALVQSRCGQSSFSSGALGYSGRPWFRLLAGIGTHMSIFVLVRGYYGDAQRKRGLPLGADDGRLSEGRLRSDSDPEFSANLLRQWLNGLGVKPGSSNRAVPERTATSSHSTAKCVTYCLIARSFCPGRSENSDRMFERGGRARQAK